MYTMDYAALRKEEKKLIEESWTDSMEHIIKEWGEKAFGYKTLHMHEANNWKSFSNRFHILIICLSCFAGVTNLSAYTRFPWLSMTVGVLNVCTGMLVSVMKYYRPDEMFQLHLLSAKKYGRFYRTISLELSTDKQNRSNADELCKNSRILYDTIVEESPLVNDKTIEWYKKDIDIKNVPDIVQHTKVIEIRNTTEDVSDGF